MGLFQNKEEKELKKLEKLNEKMSGYGLENLSQEDKEKVRLILTGLMGNGLIEFGTILSGSAQDVSKLSYLGALVEQNWIIIKLLNEINSKLTK